MIRMVWRWLWVGWVSALAFTGVCATVGWAPDDLLISVLNATAFLVGGTPMEVAFILAWMLVANRWPIVERTLALRVSMLALAALITTLCTLALLAASLTWHEEQVFAITATLNRFRGNARETTFLAAVFVVWAVLPRLVAPSLRTPIIPASSRARHTAAI